METKYGEYIILITAGSGGCGKVFVVRLNNNETNAFILKTLKEDLINSSKIKNLQNEIDILIELNKDPTNKHIPKLYAFDKNNYQNKEEKKSEDNNNIIIKEEISKDDNKNKERPYYVIDFFSKGELYYYIEGHGLSEKHARVIFKKIIEAIKSCHDKGICHLDIKPANVIFDKKFEPIIIDFGYAAKFLDKNNKKIEFKYAKGTKEYISPDMRVKDKYDGVKCDIFSLGHVLFNLVTGRIGFETSKPTDTYYSLIKDKKYEEYWSYMSSIGIKENLSENFKNLYIQMIAFNPEERPTINEILQSPWLQEYNNLGEQEKVDLENEVKAELTNRYEKIKSTNSQIQLADRVISKGYNTRCGYDGNKFFSEDLSPKKISNDGININHHLIFNGYLDAVNFMSSLINEIKNKFDDEISIITSEESLKFKITFGDEEDEEEEENKDNIDQKANTVMIVELFQYEDGRYLLEFLRTGGGLPDYYKNFLKLKEIIQNLLEKKR